MARAHVARAQIRMIWSGRTEQPMFFVEGVCNPAAERSTHSRLTRSVTSTRTWPDGASRRERKASATCAAQLAWKASSVSRGSDGRRDGIQCREGIKWRRPASPPRCGRLICRCVIRPAWPTSWCGGRPSHGSTCRSSSGTGWGEPDAASDHASGDRLGCVCSAASRACSAAGRKKMRAPSLGRLPCHAAGQGDGGEAGRARALTKSAGSSKLPLKARVGNLEPVGSP